MTLQTNESHLVQIAVEGKVAPALYYSNEATHDGQIKNVPCLGGITYNVKIGHSAYGWIADHVEPGVSSIHDAKDRRSRPNQGFNFLSCIGNEVIVLSGKAKGDKGIVTGTHGGVEHVIIDFADDTLDKLSNDDKFQIRGYGQGLMLIDYPNTHLLSIAPTLFAKLPIRTSSKKQTLDIDVAAIVPSQLMGSGVGASCAYTGDIDLITSDKDILATHHLDTLKLGDIVAIQDWDASYGWTYREKAISIGIVIHGDSYLSGHGPGIATIMTSATGDINPHIVSEMNIGKLLSIGTYRG